MAEWDGERRILNRQRTHFGHRTLQDEAKPDFHPDIFPYAEIRFPDFSRKSAAFPVRECFPTEIAHGGRRLFFRTPGRRRRLQVGMDR